jgi:hypothetical protein
MSSPAFDTLTRPSRSGGHDHVVHLDAISHTPIDSEHPCSCAAGSEGRFCWAVLEILREQGSPEVAAAARALAEARAEKSVKKARR